MISRSVLPLRAMSGSIALLQPGSILMSMASVTTEGFADDHGLSVLQPKPLLMSVDCAATKNHVYGRGLGCYLRPC